MADHHDLHRVQVGAVLDLRFRFAPENRREHVTGELESLRTRLRGLPAA